MRRTKAFSVAAVTLTEAEKTTVTAGMSLCHTANCSGTSFVIRWFGLFCARNESTNYSFVFEGFSNENRILSEMPEVEKDGIPVGTQGKSRRLGFTGNVNYTYDGRYYVDASAV